MDNDEQDRTKHRTSGCVRGQRTKQQHLTPPIDANAVIIGRFLEGYAPAKAFGPGVTVMSTDDIISALSDMADVPQCDVNRVLVELGYTLGRNTAGTFGWLMKRIDL